MTALNYAQPALDTVQAALNYIIDNGEKPVVYNGRPGDGVPQRTGEFQPQMIAIADARPLAGQLSLDREGFLFQKYPTRVVDFYDDEQVRTVYYAEVEQLLKQLTGASRVHIFDHTIRVEDDGKRGQQVVRAPVPVIHNDYTLRSGPQRVRDLLEPAEAQHYLQHRFVEVNVWRPIANTPVLTTPLAVADAQSIALEDFIATDLVYADRVGEIYQLAFNPEHRWYYFPKMHKGEIMLLKCYDSATDGRARFTAHTAFKDPTAPADAAPRESIEVRTLIAFD
jgi:hypothetical protein